MKSRLCKIVAVSFCILALFGTVAAKNARAQPAAEQTAADPKDLEAQKKRELVQKAKESFNNTAWDIELTAAQENSKANYTKDILRFKNFRFSADAMADEGFNPTNYTVRIKRSDIIWETMQTNEASGQVAFWRGEFLDKELRGVLSWHLNDSKETVYDYSFHGTERIEVVPPAEEVVPADGVSGETNEDTAEIISEPKSVEDVPASVEAPVVKAEPIKEPAVKKDTEDKSEQKKSRRHK